MQTDAVNGVPLDYTTGKSVNLNQHRWHTDMHAI